LNEIATCDVSPRVMNNCTTTLQTTNADIDLLLGDAWDSAAVSDLIRANSSANASPAYLYLGTHEAELLRQHLSAAFGEESVASLKHLYYMGLEVVEIQHERLLRVAGRKVQRTLQDPISRRPAWRDRESESLWNLRIA
jgi:hypothetical protein